MSKYNHPRRTAAQPEEHLAQPAQEPADRLHRPVRIGQIHAGVRPAAQGRAAPVHGIAGDGDLREPPAGGGDHGAGAHDQRGAEQTNRSPRSTVGTASEVYTYLRVLFARIGHRPCPSCGVDVPAAQALDDPAVIAWEEEQGRRPREEHHLPACGAPLAEMSMAHFSFNKPDGACPTLHRAGQHPQRQAGAAGRRSKEPPAGGSAGLGPRTRRSATCRCWRQPAGIMASTSTRAAAVRSSTRRHATC